MRRSGTVSLTRPAVWTLGCVLVIVGCASLPKQVERVPSHALTDTEGTVLAQTVAGALPGRGRSGFRIMAAGDIAYSARLKLTESAQRTLVLQYYWVASDTPTRTLFAALRRAADRGVRVRLLLDDLSAAQHDAGLRRFSSIPNVQVRVFNPFVAGRANVLTRMLFSVGDLARVTRRMHNKLFIADNALAIVGGRNLTAEYFSDDQAQNFADLDVLVGGAIVPRFSAVFDEYWNSDAAYPIEALVAPPGPDDPPAPAASGVKPAMAADDGLNTSRFDLANLKLVSAPARALADNPAKATDGVTANEDAIVYHDVVTIVGGATREVLIISPYFIPATDVMALFRYLRARGVTVRVLTNSLASTDMPPAFAAYSRHRLDLLRIGVELYELRAAPGRARGLLKSFTTSKTALHAKAVLVDERIVFVGSMNLDPRSKLKNTEDGLVILSPELGAQMERIFALGASHENSYAVRLSPDGQSLEWSTQGPNGEAHYSSDPDVTFLRRVLTPLLRVTVPEDIL
jgi:phosphatidylserine/phosphatidylglycerophosphate/cardiolipin synthase-like enzyme